MFHRPTIQEARLVIQGRSCLVYFNPRTISYFVQQPYEAGFKVSEAWVVVSGPNLPDFDGAPAQGGQDQALASAPPQKQQEAT